MNEPSLLEARASLDERIQAFDWSKTCLGPIQGWPESLRAALSICLGTRLPNAVFWGADALMLYNDALCALLGDEHPSAIGRPAKEGCPELWSRFGPHVDRVLASGEPAHVANWLFSSKVHGTLEERYFDCSFAPIRGAAGRIEGVFSAASETTGRVASALAVPQDDSEHDPLGFTLLHEKAEHERRQLLNLLRDVPATINFLRGPELVFEFAHPLTIAALGGRNVSGLPLLQAIPEIADQVFPELLRRVLDTGVPYRSNETLARLDRTGSGELEDSYWNIVYLPVRGPEGTIEGIMTFDVEVTEMVLARRQVEALLEDRETNDRKKDDFLAMLGHELRNPLAPVRYALATLRTKLQRGQDPSREVDILDRQTENLVRIVDDLLDVARVTHGKLVLDEAPQSLGELINRALDSVQAQIDKRRHKVTITLPRNVVTVMGDAVRLEQIIVNLLNNAAKYTDPGGQIAVELERREDGSCALTVRDNGMGIEHAFIGRMFNLFEQVDGSVRRSHGGLGVGLTVCKRLVELHGGTIEARSAGLGRGSTFVVRLPAIATPVDAQGPQAALANRVDAARVLIVDDDKDVAQSLAELLTDMGHSVTVAYDGLTAVERAEHTLPDVLLLDIDLPDLDGYEVSRRVRGGAAGGALIIASTGYGQPQDKAASQAAGFDDHLVKPISVERIVQLMDDWRAEKQRRASAARPS